MLEREQHILPVDLLFDDSQIGDYVKSIQIDSPYQQMLLEGVLTETFQDGHIYVCFTVEGYLHYILGEVLNDSKKYTFKYLSTYYLNSQFVGIGDALIYYLLKMINNYNYDTTFKFISLGQNFSDICALPLSVILDQCSKIGNIHTISNNSTINDVLITLFKQKDPSVFHVICEAIHILKIKQKYYTIDCILQVIAQYLQPRDFFSMSLFIQSLSKQSSKLKKQNISALLKWARNPSVNSKFSSVLPSISLKFELCRELNEIKSYDRTLSILNEIAIDCESLNNSDIVQYLDLKAETYNYMKLQAEANRLYQDNLNLLMDDENPNLSLISQCYHNIATTKYLIDRIVSNEIIHLFEISLDITSRILGTYHENYAHILTNFAHILSESGPEHKRGSIVKYFDAIRVNTKIHGAYSKSNAYTFTRLLAINGKYFTEHEFNHVLNSFEEINNVDFLHYDFELGMNFGMWFRTYQKNKIKLDEKHLLEDLNLICLNIENSLLGLDTAVSRFNNFTDIGMLYMNLGQHQEAFEYLVKAAYDCRKNGNFQKDYNEIIEYLQEVIENSEGELSMPNDL